jgi:hypothetical protein
MIKKLKPLFFVMLCQSVLGFLSAADVPSTYGKKGTFELSGGISLLNTSNAQNGQKYSIGLLPYANHFLLDRFFLRYDLGYLYTYNGSNNGIYSYASHQMALQPGLAIGYNFPLADRWHFNASAGYAQTLDWYTNTDSGWFFSVSHHTVIYPEIKYIVAEHWAVSVQMKVSTNLHSTIFGSSSFFVTTSTYIAASHIF